MIEETRYDFLIVGAGIIGLTIALQLLKSFQGASIGIIEKESRIGTHASGRNSGVLHSGIYYTEGSFKAMVCADGARAMKEYCENHGLPIEYVGKVIVPIAEKDDCQIDVLLQRAHTNGVNVTALDEKQLLEVEPEVSARFGRALYLPDTAIIDPIAILDSLVNKLKGDGVKLHFLAKIKQMSPDNQSIQLVGGQVVSYQFLINAAGQRADQVAHQFGAGKRYIILPFKGIYCKLRKNAGITLNGLVYPVPNLELPFLGIHSVRNVNGDTYFGPSAIPAMGRENYHGVHGVRLREAAGIVQHLAKLYILNKDNFRSFAALEVAMLFKSNFMKAVKALVPRIKLEDLATSNKVGIRAQLFDMEKTELVKDFVVEKKENTVHVLNAVSPAFTSALSFSQKVVSSYID